MLQQTEREALKRFTWMKTFGDELWDRGYSVQQTSDEGYIVTGLTDDANHLEGNLWLIKVPAFENHPPESPVITGETEGKIGVEYDYSFISSDPDIHDLFYYIEWGDGTNSGWIGPYSSGQEITVSHTWDEEDTYTIRAKARDIFEEESDWAYLEVTMPVNQHSYSFPLLQRLLERFPNAFPILRNLLEL